MLRRRKALDAARRGARASCGCRPSSPRGSAAPALRDRRRRGLRRAGPGHGRWPGRLLRRSPTSGSTPGRPLFWPCPRRSDPGHAAAVPRPLRRRPTAAPASSPSTTSARPTTSATRLPVLPGHRAGCSQHYQSGAQTRRVAELVEAAPAPVRRDPPGARRHRTASRTGTPCASPPPRGRARRAAAVTGAIRPDTVFLPFHWAGDAQRQPADQRRARPGLRDAGVQGVRRAARAGPSRGRGRRMRQVVVVGHGMVGSRFVEELVAADPTVVVTVLGARAGRRRTTGCCCRAWSPGRSDPRCSASRARRTRASRCCPGRRGRRRPDAAGGARRPGRPRTPTTSWCWPPGRPPGCRRSRGSPTPTARRRGLRAQDIADAPGSSRRRQAGRRPSCSAAGCSVSRWPPGWPAGAWRVRVVHLADRLMERQLDWEAVARWRSPACSGSASRPTWVPRSSGCGPAVGGSRACASVTGSRPAPTCSSCAPAPCRRPCWPATPG